MTIDDGSRGIPEGRQAPVPRPSPPSWRLTVGRFLLLLPLLSACSDASVGPDPADPPGPPADEVIHLVSGGNQPGLEGHRLADPVVVMVTNEEGIPVAHVPVRFSVVHGGGLLSGKVMPPQRTIEVVSDARGLAEADWTLGRELEHVLKVYRMRDPAAGDTTYTSPPLHVFAGMEVDMWVDWKSGIEFRCYSEVLPHDDHILETPSFLTFSDASSMDVKVGFAAMAEESLQEIMRAFGVSSVEYFGIDQNDPSTKITIFTNRSLDHRQFAFDRGFILYGIDSEYRPAVARLRYSVKHETMHVFQWLVGLTQKTSRGQPWPHVWFEEGIAEHTSGGSPYPVSIRTVDELNTWRAHPDHTNPISIHEWDNFPESVIERSNGYEYYPMFDLAVRYLLDEGGHGMTYSGVLAMYLDLRESQNFYFSFEKQVGLTVDRFERDFFDLVTPYLTGQPPKTS